MAVPTSAERLTREECLDLIGGARPVRVGTISVNGRSPVRVALVPLPDGDVVIPTGIDKGLVSLAAGRPVTVRWLEQNDGVVRWLIHGVGKARPLRGWDRPHTAAAGALAMGHAFENGIRVPLNDLVGERLPERPATHT